MKQESFSRVISDRKEGVTKITVKGGSKFLVRAIHNKRLITVTSFKKEIEANNCYKDLVEGKITIESLINKE